MERVKSWNSSLHNVSKKKLASGQFGMKRSILRPVSKKQSANWNFARALCETKYPKCVLCGGKAEHCHHIILRSLEPSLKYSQDNLVMLCHKCHNHSGYDQNYVKITRQLVALGFGRIYNLHISQSNRLEYDKLGGHDATQETDVLGYMSGYGRISVEE